MDNKIFNITNLSLSIFFVYFAMNYGNSSQFLLNCGLQKYVNNTIWVRHVMIFTAFYLFSYILGWYSYDSLLGSSSKSNNSNNDNNKNKLNSDNFFKYFYYTLILYVIFLLSTKNSGLYLTIFLIGLVIIVIGNIYNKSKNLDISNEIYKLYFVNNEKRQELKEKYNDVDNLDSIITIHNILSGISIFLIITLIFGAYKYYLKQSKDHSKNWSWLKFIFGTYKCSNI